MENQKERKELVLTNYSIEQGNLEEFFAWFSQVSEITATSVNLDGWRMNKHRYYTIEKEYGSVKYAKI